MRLVHALLLASVVIPAPALAGEEVLYGDIPSWVEKADIAGAVGKEGPAERLRDWQYRVEDGVVHAFADRAVRIDNPQALMSEGTLSLIWLPDKGDLTVHKLEIYRDGKPIDLIGQGARFDVLRREQGLESRLLDGQLTATLAVPGLREGDVLRTAYTTTIDDQALGEEIQVTQYLPNAPWQVGEARTIVSWPADEEMYWRAEDRAGLGEPVTRGGYKYLEVDLPLAKQEELPLDTPYRFRRPAVLRVGSFGSWTQLSQVMTPHFESAATLAPDSDIAVQARRIMERTAVPLERAALATQLVQDEVSYLLNGLDGGNYLPQAAQDTWDKRYGDCKAKSVLLLSLLREMGIESEVVLVSSRGGDAIPELLPLPAAFDHMIVHAVIDGTDYWLDGTSAAARLSNIGDVPPFYYALPLREGGAELLEMTQRELATPQMRVTAFADHSAGVDLPALMTFDVELLGPAGAPLRALVDADDPQVRRQMARNFASQGMAGGQINSVDIEYDAERAVATLHIEGVAPTEFYWEDGRLKVSTDESDQFASFNPDRARPAWRDLPVITAGPGHVEMAARMKLPEGGKGFTLEGTPDLSGNVANTRIERSTRIENGEVVTKVKTWSTLGEIAAADVAEAKRAARRLDAASVKLVPPQDVTWRWQLSAKERMRRAEPVIAAYEKAIDFAEADDFGPLQQLALFRTSIYDYAGALKDFDTLIAQSPSAWAYRQRAAVHEALGNRQAAIADLRETYDLDPINGNGFELARVLAYDGKAADALAVLDSLPVAEDDRIDYAGTASIVYGLADDLDGARQVLADEVADKPQNPELLNSDCWFRGLFSVSLDDALDQCTRAVERSDNEAPALDSRALVQYRLGNLQAAITDLDTALKLVPDLAPSIYLRGIIRLETGDSGGRQDIETALGMAPQIADVYARHGLKPAR